MEEVANARREPEHRKHSVRGKALAEGMVAHAVLRDRIDGGHQIICDMPDHGCDISRRIERCPSQDRAADLQDGLCVAAHPCHDGSSIAGPIGNGAELPMYVVAAVRQLKRLKRPS